MFKFFKKKPKPKLFNLDDMVYFNGRKWIIFAIEMRQGSLEQRLELIRVKGYARKETSATNWDVKPVIRCGGV